MIVMTVPKEIVWKRKDLVGLQDLGVAEIEAVLDAAAGFKASGSGEMRTVRALEGRTLVNFFVEPSTRTRVSFELAAHRLSAGVVNMTASASSLTKGGVEGGYHRDPTQFCWGCAVFVGPTGCFGDQRGGWGA